MKISGNVVHGAIVVFASLVFWAVAVSYFQWIGGGDAPPWRLARGEPLVRFHFFWLLMALSTSGCFLILRHLDNGGKS